MIEEKIERLVRRIVAEEKYKLSKGIFNSLVESKKYEMFRSGSKMEFRKKTDNGLVGTVDLNNNGQLPNSGYLKLAAGPLKPFKDKLELNDLVNGLIRESRITTEGEAKISKGNKSAKNSFGDDKLKDTNSNPRQEFEDYPISYEEGMEKLKGIKDKDKLDREYEKIFAQINNSHERNLFRGYYKILRDNLNQKR